MTMVKSTVAMPSLLQGLASLHITVFCAIMLSNSPAGTTGYRVNCINVIRRKCRKEFRMWMRSQPQDRVCKVMWKAIECMACSDSSCPKDFLPKVREYSECKITVGRLRLLRGDSTLLKQLCSEPTPVTNSTVGETPSPNVESTESSLTKTTNYARQFTSTEFDDKNPTLPPNEYRISNSAIPSKPSKTTKYTSKFTSHNDNNDNSGSSTNHKTALLHCLFALYVTLFYIT